MINEREGVSYFVCLARVHYKNHRSVSLRPGAGQGQQAGALGPRGVAGQGGGGGVLVTSTRSPMSGFIFLMVFIPVGLMQRHYRFLATDSGFRWPVLGNLFALNCESDCKRLFCMWCMYIEVSIFWQLNQFLCIFEEM